MAKVSFTDQHDWMRAIIKFDDSVTLTVKTNRGGTTVDCSSQDSENIELTERFAYSFSKKTENMVYRELYKDLMILAEKDYKTYKDFVDAYEVHTGHKKEIVNIADRDYAKVSVKNGARGNAINFTFDDGMRVAIKINKSSIAYSSSNNNHIVEKLVQVIQGQQMSGVDKDLLTEKLETAIKNSRSMIEVFNNFKSEILNQSNVSQPSMRI